MHWKQLNMLRFSLLIYAVLWGFFAIPSTGLADQSEFNKLVELAKNGSPEAQTALGFRYVTGQGVARSPQEAYRWYSKAARQNHPGALFSLGSLYLNGDGVPQSKERAAELYRRAANLGHPAAMDNLGSLYRDGIVFEPSDELALMWYERAANAGLARAMTNAGWMYANGRGVNQSYSKAADWYRQGKLAGDIVATYNLGLFYALGQGVDSDLAQAMRYMAHAAANGHQGALADVQTIASTLPTGQISRNTELRAVPALSDSSRATLSAQTEFFILSDSNKDWLEIYLPDGHEIGFIQRRDASH